jgi:hypothetical protein
MDYHEAAMESSTRCADRTDAVPAAGWRLFGFGFSILVFTASLFAAATVQLWLGAEPGWPAVVAAVGATVVIVAWWARNTFGSGGRWIAARLSVVAVMVIVGSAALSGRVLDTTFDGQWYHQEAVVRLAEGWNPVYEELERADYGDDRARIQLNGYPKASWLWGTALYRTIGSIEYAKSLSLPLTVAAFAITAAALLGLGRLPAWLALMTATVVAASPVAITQSLNTQLDGDLGSMLLMAAASMILVARSGRGGPVAALVMAIAVAVNLKLTAAAFAVVILATVAVVIFMVDRHRLTKKLIVSVGAGFVLGVLVVGWHPFVTNTLRHGHPLYPVMGPEKTVLIKLTEDTRLGLIARSVFSRSRHVSSAVWNTSGSDNLTFKIPFTVTREEIDVFVYPDVRVGGFGPLFGGMWLLAAASLAAMGLHNRRWFLVGLTAVGGLLVGWLIFPHPWFARFVPHGWWIPLAMVPVAWHGGGRLAKTLAAATALTGAINIALVTAGYLPATIRHSELTRARLQTLLLERQPIELNLRPFPSNRTRLSEMGLSVTASDDPDRLLQMILGRYQPNITTVTPQPDAGAVYVNWRDVPEATGYRVNLLEPPPAGPGGGALTVVSRAVDRPPAIIPTLNGTVRVMVAACNLVGCGPPKISQPFEVRGVERLKPEVGHPEDGSTVPAGQVLVAWLPVEAADPEADSVPYLMEVVDRRTGYPVVTSSGRDHFRGVQLPARGSWTVHISVQRVDSSLMTHAKSRFATSETAAPTPVTPAARSSVPAAGTELGWTPVEGARGYEYLVTVPGERTPTARGSTDDLSMVVELPARAGRPTTYHAIMRACFADDRCTSGVGWGPWSSEVGIPPLVFTVLPAEPSP